MTERLRPFRAFGKRPAAGDTPPYSGELLAVPAVRSPQPPVDDPDGADDVTIFGFPAVVDTDDRPVDAWADRATTSAGDGGVDTLVRLVTQQRADPIAGITLMFAGVAAAASLWFPWVQGDAASGLAIVRGSVAVAGAGVEALSRGAGEWEPLAIVGGALLLPVGVLLFIPSRTHRTIGLLALCVAAAVTAGVLSRFVQAGWSWAAFDRGMWCAVAASVLGIVGALKAMLRIPRVTLRAGPTVPQ